jgi:hypothetical protein
VISHSYKQVIQTKKINKETSKLNNIVDQMDLTDIYIIFHPTAAKYTSSQKPMELSPK